MARIQGVDTAAGRAGGILGQSDELAGRVFRFEFGRGSPPWPSVCIPVVLVGKGCATDVQNEADGRTSRFWAFRAKCRTHSRGGKEDDALVQEDVGIRTHCGGAKGDAPMRCGGGECGGSVLGPRGSAANRAVAGGRRIVCSCRNGEGCVGW